MGAPAAVCIAGPTASGKTSLALGLAELLPVEVISVDSAMVYRGLDIGTDKPGAAVRASVPHHLIDIREPHQSYSAGAFCQDALALIAEITDRGRLPLLVGGTLLYFRSLMRGLAPLPPGDADVRAAIDERAAAVGWPALHGELAKIDPAAATRIAPADRQRIQRALEVYELTGKRISAWQAQQRSRPDVRFVCLALTPGDRPRLHARIEARFHAMLAEGLLEEVRGLRQQPGLGPELPAMRAVGYRQLWRFLDGHCSLDQAVADAIAATRRYAKRQFTWLRSEPAFASLDPDQPSLARAALARIRDARVLDALLTPSR